MSCSKGCPSPGSHSSYGACLRDKGTVATGLGHVNPAFARDRQKAWDRELNEYAAARRQGIQPPTTRLADIRTAVAISNETGRAYRADE